MFGTRRRRGSARTKTVASRSTRARKPAKPAPRRPGPREALAGLEQRHLDLIGLALVAFGVYLALVLYGGWDGGRVGAWLDRGLADAAGKVALVAPLALFAWGSALILRPFVPAPAALNAGGVLVIASLLLAFAAGTLGLGADHPARHGYFDPAFFRGHGGAAGEALYWAATTLFQRIGTHILAILMLVSGTLLLTGATVSGVLRSLGRAARSAKHTTAEMARTARQNGLGIEGLREPSGDEIAITRANPTEALATEPLVPPDDDEPDTGEVPWEDDEAAHPDQFAYAEGEDPEGDAPDAAVTDPAGAAGLTPMGNRRGGVTASDEIAYSPPPRTVLAKGRHDPGPDTRDREAVARALLEALEHFGVDATLLGTVSGPHVSRYELALAPGTKVSKVAQLRDDLAYALASTDIRILAPIPGKKAVGVEVPNARRRLVRLGDIYDGRPKDSSPLVAWLGKDVAGHACWTDLALMPHALVAGTTGSGKSGCVNAILCSILLHASPNEVRFVLVDPKRVELNHYELLPHLLTPVVTNPRMAANVLGNLIGEMESRYQVMGEARARNLAELNRVRRRQGEAPLPHILCVIDELADLMMVAPAEVEDSIIRLAQKSRRT
jgi:S-DNA-T family DNA segregation ATPase FtsK/SpoIIIE